MNKKRKNNEFLLPSSSRSSKKMGRQRKRYSETFKRKVIVEALTSGKTMAEVAAGNNIAPSLVTEWKEAFIKGEDSKELKKAQKKLEEKDKTIETLMKKIGEKELEVELLKKKTSRFDKKSSGSL